MVELIVKAEYCSLLRNRSKFSYVPVFVISDINNTKHFIRQIIMDLSMEVFFGFSSIARKLCAYITNHIKMSIVRAI